MVVVIDVMNGEIAHGLALEFTAATPAHMREQRQRPFPVSVPAGLLFPLYLSEKLVDLLVIDFLAAWSHTSILGVACECWQSYAWNHE